MARRAVKCATRSDAESLLPPTARPGSTQLGHTPGPGSAQLGQTSARPGQAWPGPARQGPARRGAPGGRRALSELPIRWAPRGWQPSPETVVMLFKFAAFFFLKGLSRESLAPRLRGRPKRLCSRLGRRTAAGAGAWQAELPVERRPGRQGPRPKRGGWGCGVLPAAGAAGPRGERGLARARAVRGTLGRRRRRPGPGPRRRGGGGGVRDRGPRARLCLRRPRHLLPLLRGRGRLGRPSLRLGGGRGAAGSSASRGAEPSEASTPSRCRPLSWVRPGRSGPAAGSLARPGPAPA